MITACMVRLEVARDDDGSLSDDQMGELNDALATNQMHPFLRQESSAYK